MRLQSELETLLNATDETSVEDVVKRLEEEYNVTWKPLGGNRNNTSISEMQKGTATGALAELLINSKDAIFQKNYFQQYGDTYNEEHSITSYKKAREVLLDEEHNEFVEVIADGPTAEQDNDGMNIIIRDSGKGQSNTEFSNFVDTFDVGANKQEWPFSQGMYGMGSHGSNIFCGHDKWEGKSFKLIASASFRNPGEWSWTLIRRLPDEETTLAYLTINGEFPTASGSFLEQEYGTIVKLYNYQLEYQGEITKRDYGLYGLLDLELIENTIPVRLRDTRYDKDTGNSVESNGVVAELKNADEVKSHFEREITTSDLPDYLQGTKLDIFLMHSQEECRERDELSENTRNWLKGGPLHEKNSIIFAANGEKHASLSRYYLKRHCDLYHTASDILAIVDVSQLTGQDMRKIFAPSRDDLESSQVAEDFKERVLRELRENESLREEELERKTETKEEELKEQLKDTLEDVIDRNPDIREFLPEADIIPDDKVTGEETTEYNRTDPPTKLNAIETYRPRGENTLWDKSEPMPVELPLNHHRLVRFELNAPNGYFNQDREGPTGELLITPETLSDTVIESWGVNNGILNVELGAKADEVEEGMELPLTFQVTRPNDNPLSESINVEFVSEVEEKETVDTDDEEDESDGRLGLDITAKGLDSPYFDNESEAVEIVDQESENELDIYVNVDNIHLENFLSRHTFKTNAKDVITNEYVTGIGLYAFGQYKAQMEEGTDENVNIENVKTNAKGLAPFFLAYHFDQNDIEQLQA